MRRPVRFESVPRPVRTPVTKLGGQPVWLAEPQWPLSASLGTPMCFIGQFELIDQDTSERRLAYVFMTDDDELVDDTWEPDAGENAVIIQPDGRLPDFVRVQPIREGDHPIDEDRLPVAEPVPAGQEPWEFLDGDPNWLQRDETPGPGWRLIAQLTDRYGHNFGDAGIAYVFISPDGREGRFLWQCG